MYTIVFGDSSLTIFGKEKAKLHYLAIKAKHPKAKIYQGAPSYLVHGK